MHPISSLFFGISYPSDTNFTRLRVVEGTMGKDIQSGSQLKASDIEVYILDWWQLQFTPWGWLVVFFFHFCHLDFFNKDFWLVTRYIPGMAQDWRAIKSSCTDERMDWEDVQFFGPASWRVEAMLKQMLEWFAIHFQIQAVLQTIVMAWNDACSRPETFASIPNFSANKWYRHESTWDAPSLSHQSLPFANRQSRLVVYLLKACFQWVSENTEQTTSPNLQF